MFEGSKPTIRVGAGKFLGVRRIFARIFPNLSEKLLGHFLCKCFLMKTVVGMTSKKSLHVIFGAIFTRIFIEFAMVFTACA